MLLEGEILPITFCYRFPFLANDTTLCVDMDPINISMKFFACEGCSIYPATPTLRNNQSTKVQLSIETTTNTDLMNGDNSETTTKLIK